MKKHWKTAIPVTLIIFAVIVNIIGWKSTSFCDFYVKRIFPLWVETYGRLTGLLPFSVGEWMLYLAAVLLVVLFVFSLMRLLFFVVFLQEERRLIGIICW